VVGGIHSYHIEWGVHVDRIKGHRISKKMLDWKPVGKTKTEMVRAIFNYIRMD
jgi:hypothetical protein